MNLAQNNMEGVLYSPLTLSTRHTGSQASLRSAVPFVSRKGLGENSEVFSTLFAGLRKFAFTLAEVFSTNSASQRKAAFTLAEVLITLGIIGVVSSIVMPTIINKCDKAINLNKLKKAYSVMGNIFLRAQADYGDISAWDLGSSHGTSLGEETANSDAREVGYPFFQKYIVPYVQKVKFAKDTTLSELGYKEDITTRSGVKFYAKTAKALALGLNDGTIILFGYGVQTDPTTGAIIKGSSGETYLNSFAFYVDVNGPQRPNSFGKDIFIMHLPLANNSKFTMFQNIRIYPSSKTVEYKDLPRSDLLSNCLDTGYYCGILIQQDGWQIKDDYKW